MMIAERWSPARWLAAVGILSVALASGHAADAQTGASVKTTISDFESVPLASGGDSMLLYRAAHEFSGPVAPGSSLPGGRVDGSEHPTEFGRAQGLADKGDVAAWLAPPGDAFSFQFDPESSLIENSYFSNRMLDAPAATGLDAGDRFDIASGDLIHNALVPPDRARGIPDGTVAWDHGRATKHVEATYAGTSDGLDAAFIRADVVARGGDVDARLNSVPLPPLVIDLGRSYPEESNPMYIATVLTPYTAYIEGFTIRALSDPGSVILNARARGYLFEAKEYELESGARVEEWHIPIYIVVLFKTGTEAGASPDGGLPARAAVDLPTGGIGVVGSDDGVTTLEVPPGGTIRGGEGVVPHVLDGSGEISVPPAIPFSPLEPRHRDSSAPADPVDRGAPSMETALIRETAAASRIDASLDSPVSLTAGGERFALTVDPDLRGEGVLALRDLGSPSESVDHVDIAAVPYILVDGAPIKLDRSRLMDLRVMPVAQRFGLGFTGQNHFDRPLTKNRVLSQDSFPPGLTVEAIYDLGSDRYALVEYLARPDPGGPTALLSRVSVQSLSGETVAALPVHYVEFPETGPVTHGGEQHRTEFSAPLDLRHTPEPLSIGRHRFEGTISRPERAGEVTVVAAPSELVHAPTPDPSASIEGRPLALYYRAPEGVSTSFSFLRTTLLPGEERATPAPIGEICAPAQVTDSPAPDAPPSSDIRTAWWDADRRNLYTTVQLASVPTAAAPGTSSVYEFHWRNEHGRFRAGAYLDDSGRWSFQFGRGAPTTLGGEVSPEGMIRLTIPRSLVGYRDGELLRDTSVFSYVQNTVFVPVDRAPDATDENYGTGGDYVMGEGCSMPELVGTELSMAGETAAQYSDPVTLAARLADAAGDPIADAQVSFELGDSPGRSFTAITNEDGLATVTATATEAPGRYPVTARYEGDDGHEGSRVATELIVSLEDSELELEVSDRGPDPYLEARLFDSDSPSRGIAGRRIDFYSDSEPIGSAQTDADGVATVALGPADRGAARTYRAVFEGDEFYLRSSAERPGRGGAQEPGPQRGPGSFLL